MSELIKGSPSWAKGVLLVGIMVGAGFIGWKVYRKIKAKKDTAADPLNSAKGLQGETWISAAKAGVPKSSFLPNEQAIDFADQINEAVGVVYDDEAAIIAVFRAMKNQIQLSQVTYAFNDMFKKDLLFTLTQNLSEQEMNTIRELIKKLPKQ